MNYTSALWANTTLGPIFSEMLYANNTVAKNLVRVLENIKYKQVVTSISGDLVVQPYAVNPTSAGSISFNDTEIEPVKSHVFHTFTMDALRSTRFGRDMKSGAANMESNEFLQAVLDYAIPRVGKAIEADFWTKMKDEFDGAGAQFVPATALTSSNIVAEIQKIYEAIPGEILEGSEAKIYAPHSVKQLIKVANLKQAYRDIFTVDGDAVSYLGVPVEFVPLAANTILAGRSTDLVLGTDLASDFGSFEVGKVNNTGDEMFIKATFSLDAAVCIPGQKVIYTVAQ